MYVLASDHLGNPNGKVSSASGVMEVGQGSDPVGPPRGIETPFSELAKKMIELLA